MDEVADDYFRGKVAVVTGGGAGFGRDFSRALAQRGAAVAILDLQPDAAARVADEITAQGGIARAFACDVSDHAAVTATMAKVASDLGGIDFLINNAALHLARYTRGFEDMPLQDVRDLFDVNVMGVTYCTMACKPFMADRGGGAVVNLSSMAGYMLDSPYGVSKLAVRGLTANFAHEFGKYGIRVNGIAPGMMATENALATMPAEMWGYARSLQKIDRRGEMKDITDLVLFLVGPDSTFITGETIRCAGGVFMSAG